jgi:hypothetical protein
MNDLLHAGRHGSLILLPGNNSVSRHTRFRERDQHRPLSLICGVSQREPCAESMTTNEIGETKLKRSPLKMGLSRCNVDMRRYRHCTVASAVTIAPGTNFSDVLGQFFLVGTLQAYAN